MSDAYAGTNPLTGSAFQAAAITPSDSTELVKMTKGLYVGGSGDVKVLLAGDTVPVTFSSVTAGTILPIRVARVYATGTTAILMLALY